MPWIAPVLALGVCGVMSLEAMVQRTSTLMVTGCPVNARQKQPAAWYHLSLRSGRRPTQAHLRLRLLGIGRNVVAVRSPGETSNPCGCQVP
jgi:hypothetical protein